MSEKWTTPKWMKKYKEYMSLKDDKPLEFYVNHAPIHFLKDPHTLTECSRIRAQVYLLENLHKKGII